MKLTLFFDHRFMRGEGGTIFSPKSYSYEFFARRYLTSFDSIRIIARVDPAQDMFQIGAATEGEGVTVIPAPMWRGPLEFLKQRRSIQSLVLKETQNAEAILMIAPGILGRQAIHLMSKGRPFGIEVVGDPYDAFAPGANSHPLRPLFRWFGVRNLKSQVRNAAAVSYVTEHALQARYPAAAGSLSIGCSDIDLDSETLRPSFRTYTQPLAMPRLIFVGTLEQMYKRPDVLLDSISILHKSRLKASAVIVGGGNHKLDMEEKAKELGIGSSIDFTGNVSAGEQVIKLLEGSDIFVLPSQQEGLPRAMVEAMAQGLPVLGTDIGGIPELLHRDDIVPVNDSYALAAKIAEVSQSPQRLTEMSRRNLKRAQDFRNDVLQRRRVGMYRHLKEATLEWQKSIRG